MQMDREHQLAEGLSIPVRFDRLRQQAGVCPDSPVPAHCDSICYRRLRHVHARLAGNLRSRCDLSFDRSREAAIFERSLNDGGGEESCLEPGRFIPAKARRR